MSARKIVIGIIGMPASGKGTVADYLQKTHSTPKLRFSDALSTILERLHLEKTRDHQITLSEVLRETCGEDILSRAIQIGIQKSPSPVIVVDGVRREGDITTLKEVADFHLLGVDAAAETRYERAKKRAEKPEEANQSFEDFLKLDQRSTELTTRELMKQASMTFDNNGSFEHLYEQIDQYLSAIGITKNEA
ncbi:MAG: AAA family ATPase [Candidatus Uhrbacteria bacterium]|nr:AAA family ATPase [Candidatus Uhrbacteria bacterium]